MLGEKMLMKKEKDAKMLPAIVTRRQPYLLANALTTGPAMQKQLSLLSSKNVY